MNTKIQEILIRRKSKVYIPSRNIGSTTMTNGKLGAVIGNLGSLGYVPTNELLNSLSNLTDTELISWYTEIYPILQKQVGMNYYYFQPMYPNFPNQVAEASDEELYVNAILHYFGDVVGQRITPEYEKEVRFPFCEKPEPRFLGLADLVEVDYVCANILESKSSPSKQDKEDIITFITNQHLLTIAPPSFQNKERMAFTLAYLLKENVFNWSEGNVKTATDVLRIAVAYSNGDESLTKNTKFINFSRPIRRLLLSLLEPMNSMSVGEDMKRHEGAWIRLGEKLHPGEFHKLYPSTSLAFARLRNGKIRTTNSIIEQALKEQDWYQLLKTLENRPGDFARRLNTILSKNPNKFEVLGSFKKVAEKVSTPVLWQIYGYFMNRDKMTEFRNRLFLPKTPVALVSENNLTEIPKGYCVGLAQIALDAIKNKYASIEEGMDWTSRLCYIDPVCKSLLIPSGNRSTSTALRQVARGSRFELNKDKSTVRLFVYWKDMEKGFEYNKRVDLDLSAVMLDKDWNEIGHCSWTNLRDGNGENVSMVHSGDITSAPEGASEFLDINLNKLPENCAYVACQVYCYTGQKMNQLPIAFCGWMEREYPGCGEIFEPKSVVQRCDLTSDATSTTPMILDVASKEIIWCDMPMSLNGNCRAVENTMDKTIATAELISRKSVTSATLYDVFKATVEARNGIIVQNREDADFVFAEDGDINPYDIANVTSEWL